MDVTSNPQSLNAKSMLANIDQGLIGLPHFQRDYVWTVAEAAALVDSILRGYPIGSLIFWDTTETLRDIRALGRFKPPAPPAGKSRNFVLDGQQRLTSLYAALKGAEVTLANGSTRDFRNIWVDLAPLSDERDICVTSIEDRDPLRCIRLSDLFEGGIASLATLPAETYPQIDRLRDRLAAYQIPYVQLQNASIATATDVFTRVNVGGKPLTVFEIMVAKTYDPQRDFDLLDRWERLKSDLEEVGFETLEPIAALQLAAMRVTGDVRRSRILAISRPEFIDAWPRVEKALKWAVDFARQHAGLKLSRLVPYPASLVGLAWFGHLHGCKAPSSASAKVLTAYLFACGWENRFSGPVDTNLNQDCAALKRLAEGAEPEFDFAPSDLTASRLIGEEFRGNSAFCKTVMGLLARHGHRSFENDAAVDLDNSALLQANSKNFHHFFPRAWLARHGSPDGISANSVVNIVLVDDFLNKQKIRARAPSDYLAGFRAKNPAFADSMLTHLVDVGNESPVWSDDYKGFATARAQVIIDELRGLMKPMQRVPRG